MARSGRGLGSGPAFVPRLYVYKVAVDAGAAPCVYRRVLSLAICKPQIRRTARLGDWLYGFGAKRLGERLIYIARVTERVEGGRYYEGSRFDRRPDCVYRRERGLLIRRESARYHADRDHRLRDVGEPSA